jgi:hypothetical protein
MFMFWSTNLHPSILGRWLCLWKILLYNSQSTNIYCIQELIWTCSDNLSNSILAAIGAELLHQRICGAVRAPSAGRGWHRHPSWRHQEGGTGRLIKILYFCRERILIWCVELEHVWRGRVTLTWLNSSADYPKGFLSLLLLARSKPSSAMPPFFHGDFVWCLTIKHCPSGCLKCLGPI